MNFETLLKTEHNNSSTKQKQLSLMLYLLDEVKYVQSELSENNSSFLAGGLSVGLQSKYPRFSDDYDLLIPNTEIGYFMKKFETKYEMNLFEMDCKFLSIDLPKTFKEKPLHAYIIGCNDKLINIINSTNINGLNVISLDNICAAKTRDLVRPNRGREIAKDAFDLVMLEYYNPNFVKKYFEQVNALNELGNVKGVLGLLNNVYPQMERIIKDGLFVSFPSEIDWKKNAQSLKSKYNIQGEESLDCELRFLLSLTTNSTRKALQKYTGLNEFNIVKLIDSYLPKINENKKMQLKEALINDSEAKILNKFI
jgi:hypothetical protein